MFAKDPPLDVFLSPVKTVQCHAILSWDLDSPQTRTRKFGIAAHVLLVLFILIEYTLDWISRINTISCLSWTRQRAISLVIIILPPRKGRSPHIPNKVQYFSKLGLTCYASLPEFCQCDSTMKRASPSRAAPSGNKIYGIGFEA